MSHSSASDLHVYVSLRYLKDDLHENSVQDVGTYSINSIFEVIDYVVEMLAFNSHMHVVISEGDVINQVST